MEQRSTSYAAVMDAQIKLSREAGAEGMGPRSSYVEVMDAQARLKKEACARGMKQIMAIHMTNLLHSLYRLVQHMMKRLQLFPTVIPARLLLSIKNEIEILQV